MSCPGGGAPLPGPTAGLRLRGLGLGAWGSPKPQGHTSQKILFSSEEISQLVTHPQAPTPGLRRLRGSGFGAPTVELRLWGSGSGAPALGLRLWGSGFGAPALGPRLWGLGQPQAPRVHPAQDIILSREDPTTGGTPPGPRRLRGLRLGAWGLGQPQAPRVHRTQDIILSREDLTTGGTPRGSDPHLRVQPDGLEVFRSVANEKFS